MMHVRGAIGAVVVAGVLVWGCGGGGGGGTAAPMGPGNGGDDGGGGARADVVLLERSFDPQELTVQVGETVVWENEFTIFHTITPDGHQAWNAVDVRQQDETFQVTFDEAGTYEYYCEIHGSPGAGMHGTITVTG